MKTSTTSAVLPCTPEAFWAAFLDESYLRALYLEELECRAFDVIEIGETSRKLRIVPKMKLPAPVAKLIGDSFAYEDHGTLDRARNEWTWRMVQPANLDPKSKPRKDVVAMHGTHRRGRWRALSAHRRFLHRGENVRARLPNRVDHGERATKRPR